MRFYRLALSILLLTFLCVMPFSAQSDDGWYYDKPIRDISFVGLVNIKSFDLNAITNPYIGKPFTDELYLEILEKVYSLEYFSPETIEVAALPFSPEKKEVALQFTVEELPMVTDVHFIGANQIRRAELQDVVATKAQEIFSQSKLISDERALRDFYLSKGFTRVKVSSEKRLSGNNVVIVFTIEEGPATLIHRIKFEGNQVANEKTLKGEMQLKEYSLLNKAKSAFQESLLEVDKQNILNYYYNRGYADAAILDVRREIVTTEEKDELTIVFVVREGLQYTFSGINFEGNTVFSTETLTNLFKIKAGAIYNQARIQEGFMAVSDLYYEDGYTSNQFYPQLHKDTEKKTIGYTLVIVERERSIVGDIILRGNEKTKDYVIYREIPLKSGDVFSKTKLTNGLRNLYNSQYFSSVVPDIKPGAEDNVVDIIFNLEEQSTTSIEFGVTFSGITEPGAWPVSLFIKWQDTNFMGTGRSINTSVTASKDTQSVGLGYSDSWFLGRPLAFSVSFDFSHTENTALQRVFTPSGVNEDDYYFDYQNFELSGGISLGKRWIPNFAILTLNGGLSSELLRNEYDATLYVPVDSTISDSHGTWGYHNSIWSAFSMDGRDINYDPSKGWFVSQRLSWTGFIPAIENEFFARSDTKLELYYPLLDIPVTKNWNFKMILAGYSGFSFLAPLKDSKLSTLSQLYLDGMFNGRGWGNTKMYYKRGNVLWSNNIELRIPLVPGVIAFDAFMDIAILKESLQSLGKGIGEDDVYYSFGPSIRFTIPQFPLRLLFANTFKIKNGNVVWTNGSVDSKHPQFQFVLSFNLTNK